MPESFSEEFFAHLFHAAELANMTSDERSKYDKEMTTEIDKRAQLSYAREQGRDEGVEMTKIDDARNFLSLGVPAETVAKGVRLPLKTILEMQAKGTESD